MISSKITLEYLRDSREYYVSLNSRCAINSIYRADEKVDRYFTIGDQIHELTQDAKLQQKKT